MYILYINDTETTGTEAKIHDIIELSMARLIFDGNKISREQKTWHITPLNTKDISDEALAVNGYKREDILLQTEYGRQTFRPAQDVIREVELWMEEDGASLYDRLFIGHNPDFDAEFMEQMWLKTGNEATFPFEIKNMNRVLDTKALVMLIDLCTGKRRKFYNLSSCIKSFDIKKGKAHKAEEDVRMTTDLLLKMLMPIREYVGNMFKDCYDE